MFQNGVDDQRVDDTYRGSGPTKFTCRHEDTMLRLVQTKGDITATSQSGLDPKKKKNGDRKDLSNWSQGPTIFMS